MNEGGSISLPSIAPNLGDPQVGNDQIDGDNNEELSISPLLITANNATGINVALPRLDQLPGIERSISQQINSMSSHTKFVIPLMLLVLLKYFYDHFRCFVVAITVGMIYERLKTLLNNQIALKERSEFRALLNVFFFSLSLLALTVELLPYLDYKLNLGERLMLYSYIPESYHPTLLQVIWDCYLTDWIVQMAFIAVKSVAYLFLHQRETVVAFIKKILNLDWWRARFGKPEGSPTMLDSADVENQSHRHSHHQNVRPSPSTNTTHNSGSIHLTRRGSQSQREESDDIADDDTTDASDAVDPQLKISRMRFYTLLEICLYLYRTILPMPVWVFYFNDGGSGSQIFSIIYFLIKLIDVSWKTKGAVEAVETFLGQRLEFGHYSTTAEYDPQSSSYDCPICFDPPRTPVTLDCNHVFCEVCLSEWLDKEKTCPVCRKEVASSQSSFFALKQQVHNSNHMFV